MRHFTNMRQFIYRKNPQINRTFFPIIIARNWGWAYLWEHLKKVLWSFECSACVPVVMQKSMKNCVEWKNSCQQIPEKGQSYGKVGRNDVHYEQDFEVFSIAMLIVGLCSMNSGLRRLLKTQLWIFFYFFQKTFFPKFELLNSGCSLSVGFYGIHALLKTLYISVSMCIMIGQFSMPYSNVWPTEFKSLFELKSSLSIWTQRYDKNLTNLVCTVSYLVFFPLRFMAWASFMTLSVQVVDYCCYVVAKTFYLLWNQNDIILGPLVMMITLIETWFRLKRLIIGKTQV